MTTKLERVLEMSKDDRQDMLFASFCDIAALYCLQRESERFGISDRIIDVILSDWQRACVDAAQASLKGRGLDSKTVDAVASTVQEDTRDVAKLVRGTLEKFS